MTENKEDTRVRVADHLTTDADHPRDSSELAYLLGTDKRGIRAMVQRERLEGVPIIGTERGYFIAPDEKAFQTYASKRQKYLAKEEKELKLSVIAVTTKGYFRQ